MTDQLAGIEAKLNRANENIRHLEVEIARHLKTSKAAFRRKKNLESLIKATVQLSEQEVPLLLSVLAGEIVHHWRSILDHIIWQLSSPAERRGHPDRIEFPVFTEEPLDKDAATRYERKIKGVSSVAALKLIRELQPYNRTNPLDDPLTIIHDLDRFDKHRELAIIQPSFRTVFPHDLWDSAMYYAQNRTAAMPRKLAEEFYKHMKFTPEVSFRKVGRRENQPIIPTLKHLENFVRDVVARFDGELRTCRHWRSP